MSHHDSDTTLYSIVIPVYNSARIVGKTVERLLRVLDSNGINGEIILVNDGSPDNSWEVVRELALGHQRVRAIDLVRNYGQHNAVLCGFAHARGEYVITMDDDLQNPPEEITKLIARIREGDCDLVFGRFRVKQHAGYRRLGTRIVGYLNRKIFNKPKEISLTNFRIAHRDVIKRVLKHRTAFPYVPGLLLLYANRTGNVEVEHHARADGTSNYTLGRILSLVSRLLINYSSYPLRLLGATGLVISGVSFATALAFLVLGLLHIVRVPGWTSLMVLVSFLGGFIIAMLAVIGEYLARIQAQLSMVRSYHVREIVE